MKMRDAICESVTLGMLFGVLSVFLAILSPALADGYINMTESNYTRFGSCNLCTAGIARCVGSNGGIDQNFTLSFYAANISDKYVLNATLLKNNCTEAKTGAGNVRVSKVDYVADGTKPNDIWLYTKTASMDYLTTMSNAMPAGFLQNGSTLTYYFQSLGGGNGAANNMKVPENDNTCAYQLLVYVADNVPVKRIYDIWFLVDESNSSGIYPFLWNFTHSAGTPYMYAPAVGSVTLWANDSAPYRCYLPVPIACVSNCTLTAPFRYYSACRFTGGLYEGTRYNYTFSVLGWNESAAAGSQTFRLRADKNFTFIAASPIKADFPTMYFSEPFYFGIGSRGIINILRFDYFVNMTTAFIDPNACGSKSVRMFSDTNDVNGSNTWQECIDTLCPLSTRITSVYVNHSAAWYEANLPIACDGTAKCACYTAAEAGVNPAQIGAVESDRPAAVLACCNEYCRLTAYAYVDDCNAAKDGIQTEQEAAAARSGGVVGSFTTLWNSNLMTLFIWTALGFVCAIALYKRTGSSFLSLIPVALCMGAGLYYTYGMSSIMFIFTSLLVAFGVKQMFDRFSAGGGGFAS